MREIGMGVWVLLVIALAGLPAGVQAQGDDGLVVEWHFDEGSGSVLEDSSGNGDDGVIYGATWVEGKYGGALSFDGSNDYVDCGNYLKLPGDFTINIWMKEDSLSGIQDVITKGYNPYIQCDYRIFTWDGVICACYGIDATRSITILKDSTSLNTGQWYFVTFIKKGNNFFLYKDIGLVGSSTYIHNVAPSDYSTSIGKQSLNDQYHFNGVIDEVHIYNRALTVEEIKSHYEGKQTALSLTKSALLHSIKQGQTTTITLTVKNTGSTEIKDIEIADTIPQDLTFVDGETSKTYSSLTPKDSRQFQYVVRLNEAGTYNLGPATSTYADEEGEYHTVKSKPATIEVIPSLVETTDQIQRTGGSNAQSASVHLHGEKTDVVMGEDILLKLAAVNLITKPTMHVQIIITPPSGMSVTSSEFVQSGACLFTASYEIEPGVGRDIEVKMRSNQVGDFVVNGRIVYYFGDDMDNAEDHTLTLPITVRAEADAGTGAEQTTGTSESGGSSTLGFGAVVAVIGLLAAYLRRRI